jgi:hypothetical protein
VCIDPKSASVPREQSPVSVIYFVAGSGDTTMMWGLIGVGGAFALSLALYIFSALHVLSFGPVAAQRATETIEDTEPLHELRERRPADPRTPPTGQAPTGESSPGGMTAGGLSGFPIPPDSRVVSSLAREDQAGPGVFMLLDVPAEAEEVLAFYRRELRARGWRQINTWDSRGVNPADPAAVPPGAAYCRGPEGPLILLIISDTSAEQSDVRAYVGTDTDGLCGAGTRQTPPASAPARVH